MVFAGTIDIMDQLALTAVGKQQGFDVKQWLVTIIEAGIAYGVGLEINIANAPQLTHALNEVTNDVIDAFVGSAIMGGSADIEMVMAQVIGATVGNSIGDQIKAAHQTSTEVNSSEASHVGANASAIPASDARKHAANARDFDADNHDYSLSVTSNSNKPVLFFN